MSNIRSLLFLVVGISFFLIVGSTSLYNEYFYIDRNNSDGNRFIEEIYDVNTRADLSKVKGEQVLGMVMFAIKGEYTLIVDGVVISEGMSLENVSLTGVAGYDYEIRVMRDDSTSEIIIYANIIL